MTQSLSEIVRVSRRFTRSVRLDTDLTDPQALDGFICSQSAAEALITMGRHRAATSHGAFTWTGPYGSGKSSLAVALAAVLCGSAHAGREILRDAKAEDVDEILGLFRPTGDPWQIVPVVGRRTSPEEAIQEAIASTLPKAQLPKRKANEAFALWVGRVAREAPGQGLLLLIDEMGKFLEHATNDGGDIYVFQELAEVAARSGGRLVLVGILHQAFDEYANRMSREARDEWLKIHGRYLDISVSLASEEQIELISRAIESDRKPPCGEAARVVAKAMRGARIAPSETLAERLAACWPLHPVVAALLGPISRRRFGQSQRSIFGFLTSAEPFGFQEFLAATSGSEQQFEAAQLWDYLRANLEPAILASPDGHRWSTAVEAVERCEIRGASPAHLALLKGIALLDLFKDRSGLQPTPEVVALCAGVVRDAFDQLVADLRTWSVIVYRKHIGAFAIYAGSDFDIERAIDDARAAGVAIDYRQLARQAALQPILAKRHYEVTGSLRWFEIELAPLHEAEDRLRSYRPAAGSAGLFLLLVSAQGEPPATAKRDCKKLAAASDDRLIVVGWTRDSFRLRDMASELAALEHVRANRPELEGDAIARREVDARITRLSADLEDRLGEAIDVVDWTLPEDAEITTRSELSGPAALSILASRLADWRYPGTPLLRNELVNRTRLSSNAAAASRALIRAMTENAGEHRLGFEGFPAEAGLFTSLLAGTGLYTQGDDGSWRFRRPEADDRFRLAPMWNAAEELLTASPDGRSLADLYRLWRSPPFGVRDGLLPIMAVAFLLTVQERAAVYLEGTFRPQLDAYLSDRVLQDPADVSVRWVDLSDLDVTLVSELSRLLSTDEAHIAPSSMEVARTLVRRVRELPAWTLRTRGLSKEAVALRDICRHSHDPNQLLFKDLPRVLAGEQSSKRDTLAVTIYRGLEELEAAYPAMLRNLADTLFSELKLRTDEAPNFNALHRRATEIIGVSGNLRLDALATRLKTFEGALDEIEGIASLAANKPPRDWVDRDVDAAGIELAALAQQFRRTEGLCHVKGRRDGRTTLVVFISDPDFPEHAAPEIELDAEERRQAERLARKLNEVLGQEGASQHIALGALAKLGLSLSNAGAKRSAMESA